jgi:hypothetical protein
MLPKFIDEIGIEETSMSKREKMEGKKELLIKTNPKLSRVRTA